MKHVFAYWLLATPFALATPLAAQQGGTAAAHEELERSSWFAEVCEELQRGEYRFSSVQGEEGVWSAPNRSHDFRSRVSASGLEVVPRSAGADEAGVQWKLMLATKSFGRAGRASKLNPATVQVTHERVELDHGRLTEWFVNEVRGLEQGWTIASAPLGVEPLWIGLEVGGDLSLRIDEGGRSGRFVDAGGELRLRYTGLMAFDATGRELDAHLAPGPEGVGIAIDDAGAVYPLTVDPVLNGPAWTAESDQAGTQFGVSVATAGDVNGDGYSDVIVGAPYYSNGQSFEGRVFVYLGSGAGLSTSAAWTAECDQASAGFGLSVATAGDVNGDGFSDVIVGARFYDNGQTDEGRAFVYLGSGAGLSTSAAWTAEGNIASAGFGWSVATAGDVNGDGYSDVIVGSPGSDYLPGPPVGLVVVYLGSAAGLTWAWQEFGPWESIEFGTSVSTAGDVNGDGYSDVIVGAFRWTNGQTYEGKAFVYMGTSAGLSNNPAWTAEGDQFEANFGLSVATAGDVNGDGYSDVIVGAPGFSNPDAGEGRAFVYMGSGAGLSASAAWTAESDQNSAHYGNSVATAGDVNGDGYSDVIVGARDYTNGQTDEGRTFVYLGSGAGLSTSAVWTAESDQAGALFGWSVATAGDVNGDGYSDVIVGSKYYDNGEGDEGRAFVYLGSGAGLSTSAVLAPESNQAGAWFGVSVATAGDVNGDGYSDVIVGAHLYDNGQTDEGRAFVYRGSPTGLSPIPPWTAESNQAFAGFGAFVATAGDVNGDGYSDVIVGAPYYNNGQSSEGRAFVYLGSGAGLSSSAAWTAESDQAIAQFGVSVATAGDVNGDGYSDVIVGAPYYTNGQLYEGRAFVYLGSGTGLSPIAAWTAESDQDRARFGDSVATAGDVNGDGYSDVIVGAHKYANGHTEEGRAFVYLGSGTGLSPIAAWTAESDQTIAWFGYSVATAGDVNGDGYSDVIVGSHQYSNGEPYEGRAFLYQGSGTGLATSAAWTAESNQDGAVFGHSVATAGDVDGDGYSDVIVGARNYDGGLPDEGRAFVYFGSGSGLSFSPAWTAESDQTSAYFGYSVATAGDVNGDGYSDVIVGTPKHSNGQTDEGRAFLYLGNDGRGGWIRGPKQRTSTGSAPLALLGQSDDWDSFRIGVQFAKTPSPLVGNQLAHLEWEAKPLGTPFDGTNLGRSAVGQPLGIGSVLTFDELVDGLSPGTPYHWRARIEIDQPVFPNIPHTPWFSIPWNTRTETKLRTAGLSCAPTPYCTAGTTSKGCAASMSGTGTPSATASSGFTLMASAVEGNKSGLLFYGLSGSHSGPWGTGFLCVKAPTQRTPSTNSGGTTNACDGTLSIDWNAYMSTHPVALGQPLSVGDTVWAQAWFRDPAAPKTTNLSNGLQFTVCP